MADSPSPAAPRSPETNGRKQRRRRRRARRRPVEGEGKRGPRPGGLAPRPFPREPLDRALKIASAIKENNGGNPWPPADIATALDSSTKSATFFYLAAAARDYGLTDGGRDAKKIGLTELGKAIVFPTSQKEEEAARLRAFRNVKAFSDVLTYFGGNRLPELKYLKNTLKREFGIEDQHHEDFVRLFKSNCEFLGLREGQPLSEGRANDRRSPDSAPIDHAGTITVAEPDQEAGLTCFVIMPFTEKGTDRPDNFFNEVLKRLITPSGIDAGFKVVTADRRGSDVIHSTIVNSLLDADLVVADLTGHNPNVLFELGMRMHADKPVALIQAEGTPRIFDVDNVLRVHAYHPNLWSSTLEKDRPLLSEHIKAAWQNRDSLETYMKLLRRRPGE